MTQSPPPNCGILLVDKPQGVSSFRLVSAARKMYNVRKVGHAGTLDPLATGVMVLLIGKEYTKQSHHFLHHDKEYVADIFLGVKTDSYDREGKVLSSSSYTPSLEEIHHALVQFQGNILQVPPMFSAKKIQGQKLYDLARKGIHIERNPSPVCVTTSLLSYAHPIVKLHIRCSKGTYIRSIAEDLGNILGCGAHLYELIRTRSGPFHIKDCLSGSLLLSTPKSQLPFFHTKYPI